MFCFRFSLFSTTFAAAAHPSDQNPNFALPKTQKIDHVIVQQHGDQKRLHPQSAKASQNKSISDLPSSGLLLMIENNSSARSSPGLWL